MNKPYGTNSPYAFKTLYKLKKQIYVNLVVKVTSNKLYL